MDAAVSAGLGFLEITLNTENAPKLIEIASRDFDLCIGAGTVLNLSQAKLAINSGARFLVSPSLNVEVGKFCYEEKLPYFPGAFTPSEIESAWNAGSAMVKVFPASQLGPKYFKDVLGPFPEIKLMAVGVVRCLGML